MTSLLDMTVAATLPTVRNIPQGVAGTSITLGNILQTIANFLLGGTFVAVLTVARRWLKDRSDGVIELRKVDSAEDASLRADLLRLLAEARTDHANQIADIRREQADERRQCSESLHAMQVQIDGLVRQVVAFQVSSNRAMGFSPEATASADRVLAAIEKKQGEAE